MTSLFGLPVLAPLFGLGVVKSFVATFVALPFAVMIPATLPLATF